MVIMNPSTTSPHHQAHHLLLPHQQHLTFCDRSKGGCSDDKGGCLKRWAGGSTSAPVFNKRKNSNVNALELDDDLIAKALTQMSIGERSKVYESIHGVEQIKDEDDPQHILSLQNQMKQEIYRLVAEAGGVPQLNGLNFALHLNDKYVVQPKQLMRFLRTERYNPVKAAHRLARFLDWKLQLWGIDKLTRDIVLDDLSKDEIDLYKLGYGQRLPTRDRAGREVLIHLQMNQKNPDDLDSFARQMFYAGMPDEGSEKLGIVLIALYLEGFRWDRFNPKELQVYSRIIDNMPIKVASIHQCYIDNKSPGLANTIKHFVALMDAETRARVKIHQGSYTEICYALMTFGIPHTSIPLTHEGKRKTKSHLQFLQMRKKLEEYKAGGTSVALIELPLNTDILLGKGLPFQSHQGNMQLQAIVDDYIDKYHAMTNNKDKTNLAADIVLMVKQKGGRFLSKESGVWIEVDDAIAREKVTHVFQYRRIHAKKPVPAPSLVSKPSPPALSKRLVATEADSKRFKSWA